MKTSKTSPTYPLLTLVQYALAIGVLVVHSGSLFPNPVAHFVAKSLYGRLATNYGLAGFLIFFLPRFYDRIVQ